MNKPSNLDECYEALKEILSFEDQTWFLKTDDPIKLHHTLGRWLRNNWGLWDEKSELHNWFKNTLGIWHADDMSGIILQGFWCYLRSQPFDIDAEVKNYKDYWEKQNNEQQITS